ncbi:MAG TPA: U32 family peptidase [Candidatus Merdiplasma excrementigallinarum]|uniref:U32 family peptidase n=1 Tax=Candidatus Merdiplasma excrementigallinarum TaxID=2840864 RepID=A0A9D1NZX0_9FIRM|nr:U32 family peptidase [Candidatus Merdiplasma excrementigallinarum]
MEKTERRKRQTELLAPGGSPESLKAAVNAGADAIYMGGRCFSARAYAQNADEGELLAAMDYCHIHDRKLYLTVNTLLKERELEGELYDYLLPLYEHGLDAVLVQDYGVLRFIRRNFPDLPIHASTQMTVMSGEGAGFLKRQGVTRVVPARELSLEEIREMHRQTGMEIECFVHGALCYSYSGQCLMSSMIGGRSGNRGRCAQPCRLPYRLWEGDKRLEGKGKYLLSLKDICTLSILPDLTEAGVCSFKIEGRMKRAEYAAGVTEIYRRYLDLYEKNGKEGYRVDEKDLHRLMDLYNRGGFSEGYYHIRQGKSMMSMERPNHQGTPGAKVERVRGGRMTLKALEELHRGDDLEPEGQLRDGKEARICTLGEDVKTGACFETNRLPGCREGDLLVRVRSRQMLERLQEQYIKNEIQEKIKGKFILHSQKKAILTVTCPRENGEVSCTAEGNIPSPARKLPLDRETVMRCLKQTGGTGFCFEELTADLEEGLFYSVQELKDLRRRALEELTRRVVAAGFRKAGGKVILSPEGTKEPMAAGPILTASVETAEQLEAVSREDKIDRIYVDCCMFLPSIRDQNPCVREKKEAFRRTVRLLHDRGKSCFLMLPPVWRSFVRRNFEAVFDRELLQTADGFLLRSGDQLGCLPAPDRGKQMIADAGIYTYNKEARLFLADLGIAADTMPLECSRAELAARGCHGSECIVYGRIPLMITAQCLALHTAGCRQKPGLLWLEDRKKIRFPVKRECGICSNVIYNSVPLDLFSCSEDIRELEPASCRLAFTVEDAGQVRQAAAAARSCILEGKRGREPMPGTTRGHFKRGVE